MYDSSVCRLSGFSVATRPRAFCNIQKGLELRVSEESTRIRSGDLHKGSFFLLLRTGQVISHLLKL